MNTIKEVLRLKYLNNLSNRKVEQLGLASKSAISNYTKQFEQSGLSIDEVLALDDVQFKKIFADSKKTSKRTKKPQPDWNYIHNELKKNGVTRQLL